MAGALAGKVALVTGASSGIGEGIALALAEAGATVAVAARRADRLEGLVSKIEAHNGHFRFSWAAGGAEGAPLFLAGTDFATIGEDGRIAAVTGFVDASPAM